MEGKKIRAGGDIVFHLPHTSRNTGAQLSTSRTPPMAYEVFGGCILEAPWEKAERAVSKSGLLAARLSGGRRRGRGGMAWVPFGLLGHIPDEVFDEKDMRRPGYRRLNVDIATYLGQYFNFSGRIKIEDDCNAIRRVLRAVIPCCLIILN